MRKTIRKKMILSILGLFGLVQPTYLSFAGAQSLARMGCFERFQPAIETFEGKENVQAMCLPGSGGFGCSNENIRVEDLMSSDGHVWLFRTITGAYAKEFTHDAFGDSSHGYSYSLNPRMPLNWSYYGNDRKDWILVSYQSLYSDRLTFPPKTEGRIGTNSDSQPFLNPETQLCEIAYYDEVKVPRDTENVLGIIRKKDFRKIIDELARREESTILDVIRAVAESQACLVPREVSWFNAKIARAKSSMRTFFGDAYFWYQLKIHSKNNRSNL